jgi:hypothetical protein
MHLQAGLFNHNEGHRYEDLPSHQENRRIRSSCPFISGLQSSVQATNLFFHTWIPQILEVS